MIALLGIGTIMGAAAQFNVTVRGQGGHAAMPHTTVDPVVAGAAIVTALQVISATLYHFILCQVCYKWASRLATLRVHRHGKGQTASPGCIWLYVCMKSVS